MVRLIALIISILLQLVAFIVAIRLTKTTKLKISWILISIGLLFMVIRRGINLYMFLHDDFAEPVMILNDWVAVLVSILLSAGVLFIPEIFNSLKKLEVAKKVAEERVLKATILTQEKEKKRFAKDLHDGLAPILSAVKMSLSALKKSEKTDMEILNNSEMMIDEAIKSIKEISNHLSPHLLEHFGLYKAIKTFSEKINETNEIQIELVSNLESKRLETNVELALYRSVCELINNTIKHAQASKINISLMYENGKLDLLYDDNGSGFNVQQILVSHPKGSGLQNILTRVHSINGYINFENERGFKVYISVNTQEI